ncbi:hypothetical protein [Emticicia sp. C21]|uniref:hypothetical protein n=1 Tax=Emticicia sp. C21 TaxID=2302915 RepID=UPI0011C11E93|nr:hypothetical protein [Emticicia sp. C21]
MTKLLTNKKGINYGNMPYLIDTERVFHFLYEVKILLRQMMLPDIRALGGVAIKFKVILFGH